ncbi:MAG: valine--tRNA ligase [Elusimicrobia bacterium CG_4_9_14_3_um_filter_62_55]|nr:MAG: valine--tRNA ligase [Elusimicrobia bacterium CG22_combo_CG10-13_8_21_14_all_63_91]PJA17351.1 MAG: valine--tRNA ligase [Elusimicrobia bacterium CG_4_10_14_0_2_um_filter_63_34]PJB23644.1 MAG: valine--tRNA ligase [Elusimicrobia bacterium CG_4_9_14_3_um_filter_62_55]
MLEKAYAPEAVESKWIEAWKRADLFHSEPDPGGKKSYTIVIPPPNVTGALHMGHALNNTLQDVLVRYHRLTGREACWVPGTDHGGIATQNVMEKQLKAEGVTRQQLGRGKFLDRMQDWVRECKSTILGQLTRLGCGLDFGREAFTMDEARAKAVHYAFKKFYEEGLVYRGERMVNWCVRCGTALSDIEVEFEEKKGHLWHMRYPLKDDPKRFLTVATTRPETMLGDTAVAVHPKDERYADWVGKELSLPLTGHALTVVADEHVDRAFGTGAVKVTPFHDPNDFEIWQRHEREMPAPRQVIGLDGKMTDEAGAYAGLPREEARKKIVADLEALAGADGEPILEKTEAYKHSVGTCYRCNQPIEPLVSEQWFMKMEAVAEKAVAAVDDGRFTIYPESWKKPYRDWLVNIRDWCLSRQIWWGHRIPVWYDADILADRIRVSVEHGGVVVKGTLREALDAGVPFETVRDAGRYRYESGGKAAGGALRVGAEIPEEGRWLQDQDVLDTWFSSALWPLSVFGWPEKTEDFKFYYPTSVLVTGYEILYLWVARMQMMGLHFEGTVPFHHAVMHGIVRDKRGKKMSKSLGNVIDPLVVMDKYGTDATRFALASLAYPGKDIPFAEDSITGPRNFANKIWNLTRFVLDYALKNETPPAGGYSLDSLDRGSLELADRWILSRYEETAEAVRASMAGYNIAAAADALYGFLWDEFCDWYVELSKSGLDDAARLPVIRAILVQVLTGSLKMLHPFMPYITEELYENLRAYAGESADFVLRAGAPAPEGWKDPGSVASMGVVMDAVRSLRALRAQLNVPPALKIKAFHSGDEAELRALAPHAGYVRHLARLEALEAAANGRPAQSATAVSRKLTFFVPLAGVIDFDRERTRLTKEIARVAKELEKCRKQLTNASFLERAPVDEVDKIRARQDEFESMHSSLAATLESLGES